MEGAPDAVWFLCWMCVLISGVWGTSFLTRSGLPPNRFHSTDLGFNSCSLPFAFSCAGLPSP